MSISLRDLYMLGGLPLLGDTYDERILNALDLAKGSHKCCACLFKAFFHLTQQEGHNTYVQASRWINLWCRKTRKYAAPPPRKENKKSRPKATHNPSGILEAAPRWSHVSEAPFVELNIPQNIEQEVYLAAFMACWLCTFVLPGNPTATIRLETFNIACKMAKGIKLTSILTSRPLASCRSLQRWSLLPEKAVLSITTKLMLVRGFLRANACLGFAHLVKMVETSFFCDDKRGAKRILNISYVCAMVFLFYAKDVNVKLSLMYPIASVVSLDSTKHLPPGLLLTDDRDVTLAEGFKLHRQYEHFNSLSRATFPVNPTIPKKHVLENYKAWLVDVHANLLENRVKDIVINGDPNVTVREGITQEQRDQLDTLRKGKAPVQDAPHDQVLEHATQKRREEQVRHRSSDEDVDSDRNFKRNKRPSNEGSAGLHVSNDAGSSNQHSSIGEVEHSENYESLNQVVASHQSLPPSNPPHQEAQPESSHVSILPSADSFMSRYMTMIAGIWNDICEKLKETPAESVSSFKGSVERQLQLMKHNGADLSSLENRVDVFFKKAQDYDKIRSKHSEAMPVETQVAELCLAQSALKDAQQKLSETQTLLSEKQKILEDSDGQVTLLEEAIKEAEKTIKEAEKTIKDSREELTKIRHKRPKLQELVTKAREQRNTSQEVVNSAEETVKRIQETPMLTSEDEDKLSLAEKDLEVNKEDLMNFQIV
nr:uncharacterized protein LOC109157601 [Ipomoea trifida]